MVFSDGSMEDPHDIMTKGLQNISECNESSECGGNNESDNSKNLDLINKQVILAERNESSYTASSG